MLTAAWAGAGVLALSVASVFVAVIYQSPSTGPAAWSTGAVPGRWRLNFHSGRLIIAHGDMVQGNIHPGMVTLGYMKNPGWTLLRVKRPGLPLFERETWRVTWFPEHRQAPLGPLGVVLIAPWVIRRWRASRRPRWVCAGCGYDRRGVPTGPCSECGNA